MFLKLINQVAQQSFGPCSAEQLNVQICEICLQVIIYFNVRLSCGGLVFA